MSEKLTVAVVDKGGRGNALVAKYLGSSRVARILVFPGNDFMLVNSLKKPVLTFPKISTTNVAEIVRICQKENVDLVDVAQDNAVAAGLVDALQEVKIPVVGPTRASGEIEWSKSWSRNFMKRHQIPQPDFMSFASVKDGINYLKSHKDQSWFVKADGLAEGKGALPAKNNQEAVSRINELERFGIAGQTYLLEEWICGENNTLAEEFSAFAICDGDSFAIVGFAQDYKRALDNDQGENTGGMGCISPPPVIDNEISTQVKSIFEKTISGLKSEGRPYSGILYLGGIIAKNKKVYVVEFNARWGDPEAQILIPSIENDFIELSQAVLNHKIGSLKLKADGKSRVVVAGTAKGYPQDYISVKGKKISGLEEAQKLSGIQVFGASIKRLENHWVVDGGRVFYIVGEGDSLKEARLRAYEAMKKIQIEGGNLHYRTDIGEVRGG